MAESDTLIGQTVSHYRIVEKLGGGGMGVVYKAEDTRLGRPVALKFLPEILAKDAQALDRFRREARAASALNHPNFCTVHDVDEFEGRPFISMELVDGRTLRAMTDQPSSVKVLARVGQQISQALRVAHAAGIVHRDIKPENIMVRADGYVKVLDFGLARLAPTVDSAAETLEQPEAATTPGTLLGTVRYMSPEQARGESVGSATDIFSLGIIFYELATGQHPFAAESQIGSLHAILAETPPLPSRLNPEIPAPLEALIVQMLEKDFRLRPTAADVDAALVELGGKQGSGHPDTARQLAKRHTVGREKERAELRAGFESVAAGKGVMICVTGEPGIGKTTLVEDFLSELNATGQPCYIARGRCSERLAGSEAYLPFLEALESLLHSEAGASTARVMKLVAPIWYVQIQPISADDSSAARLLADVKAASQERMKRELGAFLQEVSRLRPLVLFFDDLHWAGASTVDLLTYLDTKFDSMRLLMLVTYRPTDLLLTKHPFLQVKLDLQARGVCREMPLEFLSRGDAERFLALEFPEHRFPAQFASLIHAKTEGSPLFMVDLVRYLRDQEVITAEAGRWRLAETVPDVERELPESVRSMIQRKIERLSDEDRRLLIAASVQGYEFESAILAEVVRVDPAEVEDWLEALDQVHGLVRFVGEREFPDKALSLRYRFVHVLYQNALYGSLKATRKASLSRATAGTLLEHYADQKSLVASEVALLFETARDAERASEFFLLAAQNAGELFAYKEAAALAERGIESLKTLPPSPEHASREINLQLTLGFSASATKGYAAPEAGRAMARARELCLETGETRRFASAVYGLWGFYMVAGQLTVAREMAEQFLRLASATGDPILLLGANSALGNAVHHLGERGLGEEYFKKAIALDVPEHHLSVVAVYGNFDPGLMARSESSRALWLLGYPDQARRRINDLLAGARGTRDPSPLAFALAFAVFLHQFLREPGETRQFADECLKLCDEYGIAQERAWVMPARGWALTEQGEIETGVSLALEGLALQRELGSDIARPQFLCHLVEVLAKANKPRESLAVAAEALSVAEKTGDHYFDAEVYRLKGEMLLRENNQDTAEAEACFHQSLAVARRQDAKSMELRAATSLSRLWIKQGKKDQARQVLAETYSWFTEGFDTADLKEARELLQTTASGQ